MPNISFYGHNLLTAWHKNFPITWLLTSAPEATTDQRAWIGQFMPGDWRLRHPFPAHTSLPSAMHYQASAIQPSSPDESLPARTRDCMAEENRKLASLAKKSPAVLKQPCSTPGMDPRRTWSGISSTGGRRQRCVKPKNQARPEQPHCFPGARTSGFLST